MLRVGGFSQLGQVSVRTLHHLDDWIGYRFYSVEQLPTLNRILALKNLGFSLDEISELLKDEMPAE